MTAPLRRNGCLVALIQKGCERKRRYSDDISARAAGMHESEICDRKLYIYPCTHCKGWHLTRRRQIRRDRAVDFQFPPTPR